MSDYSIITPVVAYAPNNPNAKTHGTNEYVYSDGRKVNTLCGRTIKPGTVYFAKDWAKMVDNHKRLSKTHVVYTCSRCVKKSEQMNP